MSLQPYEVILDPAALGDLEVLRDAIIKDRGEKIASAFIERVLTYLEGFSVAPLRGAAPDETRPHLRVTGWRRTLTVIYVVHERLVVILAIAYRGRDIEALFGERAPRVG